MSKEDDLFQVALDKETAQKLQEAAVRRGMSVPGFLDRILSAEKISPPQLHDDSPPKKRSWDLTSQMEQLQEMFPMILMSRLLGQPIPTPPMSAGNGHSKKDEEDEDESPLMRRLEKLMLRRAEYSMLAKMLGEDSSERKALDGIISRYDEKISSLQEALHATKEEARDERIKEREERYQQTIDTLQQQLNDVRQELLNRSQAQSQAPDPNRQFAQSFAQMVRDLTEANRALDELREVVASKKNEPPRENSSSADKIGYLIDKVSTGIKEGLQGAGAFIAGQRGVPPDYLGAVPAPPPQYPPQPAYAPPPPPSPVQTAPPAVSPSPPAEVSPPPSQPVNPIAAISPASPATPVVTSEPRYLSPDGKPISREEYEQLLTDTNG